MRTKIARYCIKIFYYIGGIHWLLLTLVLCREIVLGNICGMDIIGIFIILLLMLGLLITSYRGMMNVVFSIEIEDKKAKVILMNKKQVMLEFDDIKRIVYKQNDYLIELKNSKPLKADRLILPPIVTIQDKEHLGILPEDFVGVRFDYDY